MWVGVWSCLLLFVSWPPEILKKRKIVGKSKEIMNQNEVGQTKLHCVVQSVHGKKTVISVVT